jgi:hypothetical protein
MRKYILALLAVLAAIVGFSWVANADHGVSGGGQFCPGDHVGVVDQDDDGDWYVCEERDDDTQPRWYSTEAPTEPESDSTEDVEVPLHVPAGL